MAFISVPFESVVTQSNLHDGVGNPITSQVNGAQRALDIGINVAGVQIDPRDIRALTNVDVVTAEQGGQWDITDITGTIPLPTGAATEATLDSFYQLHRSNTVAMTSVSASTSSVSLVAANTDRKQLLLFNNSNRRCYVAFAATSSTAAFTVMMEPNAVFVLNNDPIYTGQLSGIWASGASGDMQITELD